LTSFCYAGGVSTVPGLRERRKAQTRQTIADTALRLFTEHGFDQVTVAEVAREAEVSEATLFNYFSTKEDLVYSRMGAYETRLIDAIRNRDHATSALAALTELLLRPQPDRLGTQDSERLATMARMVTASPALLARERQVFSEATAELAALLAEQTHADAGDVTPWVVANALMGVHHAVLDAVRRRALAGQPNPGLARDVRAQAQRALALLEQGLGGFGAKDHPPGPDDTSPCPGLDPLP
jgi:AcrR family transcriptional regulator